MKKPDIKTVAPATPMIYAYTTPEIARHNGWTKIGYTEIDVDKRVYQQTHTSDVDYVIEWRGNAIFDDGSGETFTDKPFHKYLRKLGIEQEKGKDNEWFHVTGPVSKRHFNDFRENRGILLSLNSSIPYCLRDEQAEAVQMTKDYYFTSENRDFLWNAKPRFGKTLAVYDFCKEVNAKTVLIVTNRPAIANSWFSDYATFFGEESGYVFVSDSEALKGISGVISREEYITLAAEKNYKRIEFISLQDLKGSIHFGGKFDKLDKILAIDWDVLVIDEAHEGVDTLKTDVAFDKIRRKFSLYLSGTPFKALANSKFPDNAIYNWTYADEQKRKVEYFDKEGEENPYSVLPKLNLYTYKMSDIVKEEIEKGIEIDGETVEYAFDLNEFFSTTNGKFNHDSSVDKFLDALTLQEKFPFSTKELRDELNHTFWLLDRVDSAKALARKLEEHPIFKEYTVVLAAGDGKMQEEEILKKSYDKVKEAISENEKTITLSVGQLTTGVTIPEWMAVLMLSNVKSPALYMQAAFRAQNPCLFRKGINFFRKENAYVFDFDPARTLTIYEEFANDLSAKTAAGKGDIETRKNNIRELLNFFPVVGEDEDGELIELDADKVLTIPRKIRSVEVVKRGFMSNFLFQNINNVFSAPKEVLDIITGFEKVSDKKYKVNLSEEVKKDLSLDENGEVSIDKDVIIGISNDLFGEKVYGNVKELMLDVINEETEQSNSLGNSLTELCKSKVIDEIVDTVKDNYNDKLKASDIKQIKSKLETEAENTMKKVAASFEIANNVLEHQKKEALQNRHESNKTTEEIEKEFAEKKEEARENFKSEISSIIDTFAKSSVENTVKTVETTIKEREKKTIEDGIKNHLRGFSRTIPSFLMAYGENTVTLATFDTIIPDNVFKEVTSISLDQFKFLRDGGKYIDSETGEEKDFKGQLFDEVVFDDSVKEFLSLKKKLANYFDERSIEDIFDYIPPQKTNQIFTPKDVVKKMVDMLENENPGCFDVPENTFIDLYMKSGLYMAEIVKRLYQSNKLKELFPDKNERLKHIFEHQVYGLAPTEIIYKIATSFILGFDEEVIITNHNFRHFDSLPYAQEGTLEEALDDIFGRKK